MNIGKPDRSFWFYFFLALTVLVAVQLERSSPEPTVLALLDSGSAEDLQDLLDVWGPSGRADAAANLGWDFLFIFAYVGFLLTAIWRYARKGGRWLIAYGHSLLALPLVVGLFDAVENFLLLDVLRFADGADLEFIAEETLVAASWVAVAKYSLATLSLFTILLGIYKRNRLNRAKGWRSMTTALADEFENGGLSKKEKPLCWEGKNGVREREHQEIRRSRERLNRPKELEGENGPIGLSFSGGGIRSATFNLGIIQALAKRGGLKCIDYLSVVSGGGYIGGWLSKWISEERGVEKVEAKLEACCSGDPEPPQLSFLRRYSNYLTPETGLFSADTWTTVATYLRNFLLNQVILAAGGLSLLLVPRLLAGLFDPDRAYLQAHWHWLCLGIGALLTFWALLWTGFNLAHFDPAALKSGLLSRCRRFTSQGWIVTHIVAPMAVTSIFGSYWLHKFEEGGEPALLLRIEEWLRIDELPDLAQWILFTAVLYSLSWAISQAVAWLIRGWQRGPSPSGRLSALRLILWALPAGAVGGALLALAQLILAAPTTGAGGASIWRVIVFGPALVILVVLGAAVVHIGLMGTHLRTGRREWMARAGAWLLIFAAGWVVFAGLAVYGPVLIAVSGGWLKTALASGWVASTIGGILAARSRKTSGEKGKGGGIAGMVTQVVPYVFIIGLITLLALALDGILVKAQFAHGDRTDAATVEVWARIWAEPPADGPQVDDCCLCVAPDCVEPAAPGWGERFGGLIEAHDELLMTQARTAEPLVFFLLFALVCVLMARRVDINEYSMHHFYRNRLTRCYLGASTPNRTAGAQLFTGFNPDDDIPLSKLATLAKEENYAAPLLIVNTALNLVHGDELAWQQRKAASFVMTPLHCGFELPGAEVCKPYEDEESGEAGEGICGPDESGGAGGAGGEAGAEGTGSGEESAGASAASTDSTQEGGEPTEGGDPPAEETAPPRFRRATVYAADRRSGLSRKAEQKATRGLGLGTAMAISGAAVSPNMGYHSSPALTFLLTVFNVRLGWWLGNPGNVQSWRYSGPRFGLFHLLAELFGQTSSNSDYVYLSDGGHFENIGLYELVRRRCRVIIACDCGADEDRKFSDLGNAIRKCRVDLHTDIRFDAPIDRGKAGRPWAVGEIHYPHAEPGTLILIKPTLRDRDPEDVRSYSEVDDHFPQQTTGDQWFDESQFESYRMLGYTIGQDVFGDEPGDGDEQPGDGDDKPRSCDFVGPLLKRLAEEKTTGGGGKSGDPEAEATDTAEVKAAEGAAEAQGTGGGETHETAPAEVEGAEETDGDQAGNGEPDETARE